ncbi:2-oxoglutarate dehydrogenase complex dihydrolipoyllysine-residue succinyltransferase [Niveispirillum cyanobacteriorum]|uniref:Dihydrolipoyllysine-residue succinyltransferase component of 2-oxoglutarate dehydrogenase complex n=1 Tax=Niveispirillum cyanobacteriorum TaxID=1612173 RepID=A0A2K9NC97_9PROT|nr:2-oxoglutarate dehydrogenase complex dihydrolipoyllysine-residue succinyltransferase [Niveispirillum cyanobacteriorum]AUN30734.1 dihydrolipoyllysine-residue succinyltransferase [Niveispirillum cyanobacteriorum]GGE51813.1 dihydrolipoyllysine-residue succinyltransferase component of 2-oxoglutarate dehydrogenase complex [Niveispirillum cyanobacteriorum]
MATEIKVPTLGESVTEATVARWLKKVGDAINVDDPLVELETDKVTLEVNAQAAGTLAEIVAAEGANVAVGALLGVIGAGSGAAPAPAAAAPAPAVAAAAPTPAAVQSAPVMPAAAKIAADNGIDTGAIAGTGKDGRVTKGDVLAAIDTPKAAVPAPAPAPKAAPAPSGPRAKADREERVRMTRLRQRIAERLKEAQNTAAMLTTFNEVDMTNVIAMRNQLKDAFEKKHGVKLGFMSFFVKACLVALKELPAVNAEIDGTDLVYKNYYDIGVAVGTPQGLVVPVVRDADKLSFAGVEKTIGELGKKARDGKLSMEDLSGGTFTISNGGVYGSLMSTPILNTPQSGILGMHKTMDRAVVVNGKVEVRPMMYLALSYDHRIIDGREAVTFLVRVKECIENPERILLDV